MHDDTSAIPSTGCSVLTGEKTLTNYTTNTRKDFVFNGGTWYLYRTTTQINPYNVDQYNCITISDLNTNAQYVPLVFLGGFGLALLAFSLLYKLVRLFS